MSGGAARGLTGVVVGAGDRGYDSYARLFLDEPDQGRMVAVAEPDAGRRNRFAERYSVAGGMCFDSWEELFARPPAIGNSVLPSDRQAQRQRRGRH